MSVRLCLLIGTCALFVSCATSGQLSLDDEAVIATRVEESGRITVAIAVTNSGGTSITLEGIQPLPGLDLRTAGLRAGDLGDLVDDLDDVEVLPASLEPDETSHLYLDWQLVDCDEVGTWSLDDEGLLRFESTVTQAVTVELAGADKSPVALAGTDPIIANALSGPQRFAGCT